MRDRPYDSFSPLRLLLKSVKYYNYLTKYCYNGNKGRLDRLPGVNYPAYSACIAAEISVAINQPLKIVVQYLKIL